MQSDQNRLIDNQSDQAKIKQEILAELDSFLLENNHSNAQPESSIDLARVKALRELDRLIKQDLSASEILTRLKSRSLNTRGDSVDSAVSDFYSSVHVVDLRHDYPESLPKKNKLFGQFFHKSKDTVEQTSVQELSGDSEALNLSEPEQSAPSELAPEPVEQVEQENQVEEIEPKNADEQKEINNDYRLVFKKTAVIALITTFVLLPIQGIIFFGQLQADKDKLLDYGQSGFLSFRSGIIKASSNSYHEADVDFANALADFANAKNILNSYEEKVLHLANRLPLIGDTIKSGENLLEISSSLSQAAKIINQKREQSINLTDYIVVLNQQLDELLPLLEDSNERLDKIVGVSDELKSELANLKKDLGPILVNLKELKTVTVTLESLLGSEKEQRYLLLFQNNNELRAAGGFIGSYALVDVHKGQIVQLEIPKGGTYDLAAGQKKQWRSPEALAIVSYTFNIWDANWWPDFPSSAKKITKLFSENSGSSVDGVISINATVLQKLLAITGPIDLPEYNTQITSDNVIDILQNEIEGKRNEANPKTIISDLAPKILEKIFSVNANPETMFGLLAEILQNKDLQVYSTDKNIDQKISSLGWRGEMMDTDRDYLWVVSSNIAGGKTDLKINQLIEHQAVIDENGEIVDTLKITRSNDGSVDNPFAGLEGANVSYLRFFVPEGSQLLSASGFDEIPEYYFSDNSGYDVDPDLLKEESKLVDKESKTEIFSSLNRTVFANWQTLKAGETKTVTLVYKLPFKLDLGSQITNDWKKIFLGNSRHFDHYSLLLQSQSGQHQTIFDSQIILPNDTKVIWQAANDENKIQVQNQYVYYNQQLHNDQYFGFVLTK